MEVFDKLEQISFRYLSNCTETMYRSFHEDVDWNSRLIGVFGGRGTGKTTLLLQRMKKLVEKDKLNCIYLSLDHPTISSHSLYEIAEHFSLLGGDILFLDEVHHYENWSGHIKSIYDTFPELKIVFSGSSAIHLHKGKGDLSRRVNLYKMPVLSFREFLEIETSLKLSAFTLKDIISNHIEIAESVTKKIKPLKYFKKYLEYGCYPFYLEGKMHSNSKLHNIINQVIETDLVIINNIEGRFIHKLKKLLAMISTSLPYQPNMIKLSEAIEISRPLLYQYLYYLQDANLIYLLQSKGKGYARLIKPEKIYLENTNLVHSLCEGRFETGTIRETFFINQLKYKHLVEASPIIDFLIDEKWSFEVGGKNKSGTQLKKEKNSFIVSDDIDIGIRNRIPLWLFGFLH